MREDIERVLISREQIARRVAQLAGQIVADHVALADEARAGGSPPGLTRAAGTSAGGGAGSGRAGAEITIVPILTGAMIFCGDLIRHMPLRLKIGVMSVSSYPGKSLRTAGSQLIGQQVGDLRGRHVLLVDDILDSGGTLGLVLPALRALGPASLKTCVLLRKDRPSAKAVPVDYVGFEIPDEFVVGYGLDYDDYYRNVPDIVTLKRELTGSG